MARLVDFPAEVWQALIPYLQSRHYARLAHTGDATLLKRLRSARRRHLDVDPLMHVLSRTSIDLMVLAAESLSMRVVQLPRIVVHPSLFSSLVGLTLQGDDGISTPLLNYFDFTPFVSLRKLEIRGYAVTSTLTLPHSICAAIVLTFASSVAAQMTHPIQPMVLVHDVQKLESLTQLVLKSCVPSVDMELPPFITSLYIPVGKSGLPALPGTLVDLAVSGWRIHINQPPLDIYELVARRCPSLTSLIVEDDVIVSAPLPPGLRSLYVESIIVRDDGCSLREAFQRLPQTLRDFSINALVGSDKPGALDVLLPRLSFDSLDWLGRVALGAVATGSTEYHRVSKSIFTNLLPWVHNDRRKARAYLCEMRRARERNLNFFFLDHTRMDIHDFDAAMLAVGSDLARELSPHLLRTRTIRCRFTATPSIADLERTFCVRMLELGAIDWLSGMGGAAPPLLKLSDAVVQHLVELRLTTSGYEGSLQLLLEHNVLVSLERIKLGPTEVGFNAVALILYNHRSSLPRLQHLEGPQCTHELFFESVTDETVQKLAEMRLYEKHAYGFVLFVYRVQPPRKSPSC